MSAIIAFLLGLLGFKSLDAMPKEYVAQTKDGVVLIDPAIAHLYSADEYDHIKQNVYQIQAEAYPGGFGDTFVAD